MGVKALMDAERRRVVNAMERKRLMLEEM